ncbi:MAG TPA: crosslink repair DNA glycosylase YcaQ family protein, partial [Vicinamibacterales bacterium]
SLASRRVTLDDLRRAAVARSLFTPTTLQAALDHLGFVQADPIRAPARAPDLTLRHRVSEYRAGDLERRYRDLDVHEDFFVNYGFVSRAVQRLMHPRGGPRPWTAAGGRHVRALFDFVAAHGPVHPRAVDEHFSHGRVTNYWGGSSNATTHLLEAMHYRGLLRVVRRESGVRVYAVHEHEPGHGGPTARRARLDALVDVIVRKYGPLPAASLSPLVRRLRFAVPQWAGELDRALARAKARLSQARVDGVNWYWLPNEAPAGGGPDDTVRLLAPFDPVVWDRRRFEILWGWAYRFEAYTPVAQRTLGYYALPLLWRDRVIGWGNLTVRNGALHADLGYVSSPPRDRGFRRALDDELNRMRAFLGLSADAPT